MADKYILIEKNKSSRTLSNLASSEVDMVCMKIDSVNETAANTELATINSDFWSANASFSEQNGDTTDALVLPKEAIT